MRQQITPVTFIDKVTNQLLKNKINNYPATHKLRTRLNVYRYAHNIISKYKKIFEKYRENSSVKYNWCGVLSNSDLIDIDLLMTE